MLIDAKARRVFSSCFLAACVFRGRPCSHPAFSAFLFAKPQVGVKSDKRLSLDSCRLAGNRLRPQGPQKLFAGYGAPLRKLEPSGFCFPPCTHANPAGMRATRRATGAGAKEDIMEVIDTKAKKGIRVYLERRGFEILEEDWAHGGDVADFHRPRRGRPGLRSLPDHAERRRGIPRGGRGPSGARTAGDGLPR